MCAWQDYVLAAVPVCTSPSQTVGLGDAISATGLAFVRFDSAQGGDYKDMGDGTRTSAEGRDNEDGHYDDLEAGDDYDEEYGEY